MTTHVKVTHYVDCDDGVRLNYEWLENRRIKPVSFVRPTKKLFKNLFSAKQLRLPL